MKILFDYGAFISQSYGGVSRVMGDLIEFGNRKTGVDCRVGGGVNPSMVLFSLKKKYPQNVFSFYSPPLFAKQRITSQLNKVFFPFFSYKFKPDICHYTFFKTPLLPPQTKTVITIHDLIFEKFPKKFKENNIQVQERRQALKKADGIICVSENTRNDLMHFYELDESKVVVGYNGNSLNNVNCKAPPSFGKYLLYIGTRSDWYKNFNIVLKVLSDEADGLKLICFGGGNFTLKEQNTIKKLNLQNRVFHLNGDDEILVGLYKNAFALVYPSIYEGFGLPPIEAMSLGCPVIASNAPPMPEIIEDAAVFFSPESKEELKLAIEKTKDKTTRTDLKQKGLARAENFSWEKSCNKIFDFYRRIIDG